MKDVPMVSLSSYCISLEFCPIADILNTFHSPLLLSSDSSQTSHHVVATSVLMALDCSNKTTPWITNSPSYTTQCAYSLPPYHIWHFNHRQQHGMHLHTCAPCLSLRCRSNWDDWDSPLWSVMIMDSWDPYQHNFDLRLSQLLTYKEANSDCNVPRVYNDNPE